MERGKLILLWLLVIGALIYVFTKVENKIIWFIVGGIVLVYAVIVIAKIIKTADIDWD